MADERSKAFLTLLMERMYIGASQEKNTLHPLILVRLFKCSDRR